ncbi:MAG: PD-(D/E)XK nuclease family protein [Burkholderiales bacterium]
MRLTNKFGLPEPVVKALTRSDYDRGESNRSITQLIDSPRIRILRQENWDAMEEDVSEKMWAVLGSAAHKMFEETGDDRHVTEERIFSEIDGWVISGAIDVQRIDPDGITIMDYKTTSVWSVILGKKEWEHQLNCYAYLVRKSKGFSVKSLKVVAILRDWKSKDAELKNDYPKAPIVEIDIPLWSNEKQDAFLHERVRLHQSAEFERLTGGKLPECSSEERWQRPSVWAVKKKGNKRALKLYYNEDEAKNALEDGQEIEFRQGEFGRCAGNWCKVNAWCDQYQQDPFDSLK